MREYVPVSLILLLGFALLHGSVAWIGNRPYSKKYESYCLIKKRGIMKLIYFKPKHFNRYTLDEVLFFFVSFAYLLSGIILHILSVFSVIPIKTLTLITFVMTGVAFLAVVVKLLYIDTTQKIEETFYKKKQPKYTEEEYQEKLLVIQKFAKDKKAMKILKKSLEWEYKYGNSKVIYERYLELYKKNIRNAKRLEEIDSEFIGYYKNYKKIKSIKIEKNKAVVEYF